MFHKISMFQGLAIVCVIRTVLVRLFALTHFDWFGRYIIGVYVWEEERVLIRGRWK